VIEKHKKINEKINVDQIIDWTLQAAKGLRDLHSERIIHRDIKPQNIFLTSNIYSHSFLNIFLKILIIVKNIIL
jgi:serine/threonine protein kinase